MSEDLVLNITKQVRSVMQSRVIKYNEEMTLSRSLDFLCYINLEAGCAFGSFACQAIARHLNIHTVEVTDGMCQCGNNHICNHVWNEYNGFIYDATCIQFDKHEYKFFSPHNDFIVVNSNVSVKKLKADEWPGSQLPIGDPKMFHEIVFEVASSLDPNINGLDHNIMFDYIF